jgi:hypothetical protein
VDFADLTLADWRRLDAGAATRLAEQIAERVGGRVSAVTSSEYRGAPLHQAVIEREEDLYALVPGGRTEVGYDVDRWQPADHMLAWYREETIGGRFGFPDDPCEILRERLSPRRAVTLPAFLLAVESERLTDPIDGTPQALAERGLRMPCPDEWEHACGLGGPTLWWWAEHCPFERSPYPYADGPHRRRNPLGLHIAHEVYDSELTSDPAVVKGGDGGEAVCGGYGSFVEWLPLATANRNPGLAQFVRGEGAGTHEEFSVRPVIEL